MSYVLLLLKRDMSEGGVFMFLMLLKLHQSEDGNESFLPAAEETALDDFDDVRRCFFLTHLRIKTSSDKDRNNC